MPATGLFEFPSAVADARRRLFSLEEEVVLSSSEFKAYWPHIDNVWSSARTP